MRILTTYGVTTINDAGCGDLAWMRTLMLGAVDYVGYDVHERHTWPDLRKQGYQLVVADVTTEAMRKADLVVCRDVFIHLPNDMVIAALKLFREAGTLLLTTSYTSDGTAVTFDNHERMNTPSLLHAKLDLSLPPFNLGRPIECFAEDSPNKYMGLWELAP